MNLPGKHEEIFIAVTNFLSKNVAESISQKNYLPMFCITEVNEISREMREREIFNENLRLCVHTAFTDDRKNVFIKKMNGENRAKKRFQI